MNCNVKIWRRKEVLYGLMSSLFCTLISAHKIYKNFNECTLVLWT